MNISLASFHPSRHPSHKKLFAFTLLEILLVVAAIAILAGIVIIAINPAKQLADNRNAQRRVDIGEISSAVYQYAIDNGGTLPATIGQTTCDNTATKEICKTGGNCAGIVDLSVITNNEKYLPSMPRDPQATNVNGTGYFIAKSANGRITVCAPSAENAATISVTR